MVKQPENCDEKSICKYAQKNHISIKQAMKDFMLLKYILQNPTIQKEMRLEEEEIKYLKEIV